MGFGRWLRREREKRGWSQAWVARHVGVSRSQMNNIEAGRSGPGRETLHALCALYGADPEEIMRQGTEGEPVFGPSRQYHPGVELLAASERLRAQFSVTDRDLEDLRSIAKPRPIETVEYALAYLQLLRMERRTAESEATG